MINLISKTEEYFRKNIPSCWDKDVYLKHVEDVREYALILAKEYGEDPEVAEIAALLHDVGYKYCEDGKGHAGKSAEITKDFLNENVIDAKKKESIISAIAKHSMKDSSDDEDISMMDQIIRDADGISFMKNNIQYFYEYSLKEKGPEIAKEETRHKIAGMKDKVKTDLGIKLVQEFIDNASEMIK